MPVLRLGWLLQHGLRLMKPPALTVNQYNATLIYKDGDVTRHFEPVVGVKALPIAKEIAKRFTAYEGLLDSLEWAIEHVSCPDGGYHENSSCLFCTALESARDTIATAKKALK